MSQALVRAVVKVVAPAVIAVAFGIVACALHGRMLWSVFMCGLVPGALVSAVMHAVAGDDC